MCPGSEGRRPLVQAPNATLDFALRDTYSRIMSMTDSDLVDALGVLGDLLEDRGTAYEIVLIGGGALLLQGLVDRPTKDLDMVARVEGDVWIQAEPLPEPLAVAIEEVAGALGLPPKWLNAGPSLLMRFGLPEGFAARTSRRTWGSLTVHLAARVDQVALKLYASVDQGPASRHFADLQKLDPTDDELVASARWCRTHDPSDGFHQMLVQVLAVLGVEVDRV